MGSKSDCCKYTEKRYAKLVQQDRYNDIFDLQVQEKL